MTVDADSLGRIAKLLIDRDDMSVEEATGLLRHFRIVLQCGPEVARSPTWQAAVLTAANIASRCFPGGVRVQGLEDGPTLVPWIPGMSFPDSLAQIIGMEALARFDAEWNTAIRVGFGTVGQYRNGLQTTFDGWTCATSPLEERVRLPEREGCVLAGIVVGALAISEIFLGNFGCAIEAGSRVTGLSLWRPDLTWDEAAATGIEAPLHHLPGEIWFLGLGHLGQAFIWAFSMLPYLEPSKVNIVLQDFDRVVLANCDSGLLSYAGDMRQLKTRVVNRFLEDRSFQTRLIERRFDERTRPQQDEPRTLLPNYSRPLAYSHGGWCGP
jgi:hypothetical protein